MQRFAESPITPSREVLPGISIRPQVAHTSKGLIEFDFTDGSGPVVMCIHGGIGGCDQARIMAEWIDPARYRILSPSRPGYLGTPLETGRTIEQQADALLALLDILRIKRVTIVGALAGGPPAYSFAIRHPKRVDGLIIIDGVSGFYDIPETAGPFTQAIFLSELGQKLLLKVGVWKPRIVLQSLFQSEGLFTTGQIEKHIEYVMADERLLAFVKAFTATMSPHRLRTVGTENDIEQYRQCHHLPVERIKCPSLIIHGTHDADVKFYDGVYAHEHIPDAERFWIEEGSHLGFWISPNAGAAQQAAKEFLDRCNP
jgi:pimeloyl-ACP methyl ester carboxylesterase